MTVISGTPDIYASHETKEGILGLGRHNGLTDKLKGLDVNILTEARGIPPPPDALRTARIFSVNGVEVPLVDPFDLLDNKLRVNRPKDRPHIEVMMSFVEEEVVAAFETETEPRERLAPARRLLRVLRRKRLPEPLSDRLVPLARTPADFRFLANSVPARRQAEALIARAGDVDELRAIVETRRFS